jgi:hypothetical protein
MAFACITPEQRDLCLIMVRFLTNSSAAKKTLPSLSSVDCKRTPAHTHPEDKTLIFQLIEE